MTNAELTFINSTNGRLIFNKLKKQAGYYTRGGDGSLPGGGDFRAGWCNRWFSIDYGPTLRNNAGKYGKKNREQGLTDVWTAMQSL